MRRYLNTFFIGLGIFLYTLTGLFATQRKNCNNAFVLCDTAQFSDTVGFASYGTGAVNDFSGGGPSCTGISEILVYWYKFEAANSGTFEMGIYPNTPTDDWQFVLYDVTAGCGAANWVEIACNDSAPNCGPTGISTIEKAADNCMGPSPSGWSTTVNLTKGKIYEVLVAGNNATPPSVGAFFTLKFHMNGLANPVLFSPTASITPVGPLTICNGDSVKLTADTAASYKWYRNGALIPGASSVDYYAKLAGSYTVVVTNTLGCSDSLTTPVVVNVTMPVASINPLGPITICNGDSTLLTAGASDSYEWYRNGTAIVGAMAQTYYAKLAGNYTVKVTLTGCTDSLTTPVVVNVNPIPTANIVPAGPVTICNGDSQLLTSDPATTYKWYRNGILIGGATAQTYYAKLAGDYTIVVTNAFACEDSLTTAVTVNVTTPVANITPAGPSTICNGDSVVLTADPSTSYQWYRDGAMIGGATAQTYSAKVAGAYTVKIFLLVCPDSTTTSHDLTVNPTPTANIVPAGPVTICNGDSQLLTSDPATTYKWYRNGILIGGATAQTYYAKLAGDYTIVVTNAFACEDSLTTAVTVNVTTPVANITPAGPSTICNGDSVVLTADPSTSYQWYRDGAMIGGATAQTYSAKVAGAYTVKIFLLVCPDSTTISHDLTIVDTPTASISPIGPVSICNGDSTLLTSDSMANAYQWYRNGGMIGGATGSTYFAKIAGTYTLKVTNAGLCSDSTTTGVVLNVNPIPTATINPLGPINVCEGDSTELLSDSVEATYQWYLNGVLIVGATDSNYFAKQAGSYTLKVTDGGICSDSLTTPVVLTVVDTPTASISPVGPLNICNGDSILLTSDSIADAYQWYFNGGMIGGAVGQTYYAKLAGGYTLMVANAGICSDSLLTAVTLTTTAIPVATINPLGPISICGSDSVLLTTDSAGSIQWYLDGAIIPGATDTSYYAKLAGNYTVKLADGTCTDSLTTPVTVNIFPGSVAAIVPAGTVNVCMGDSINLIGTATDTIQWYRDGVLIPGATDTNYYASIAGNYTIVIKTTTGCTDSLTTPTTVIVDAPVSAAIIDTNGTMPICNGQDTVELVSEAEPFYQWLLNGAGIGGATNINYFATLGGDYQVIAINGACRDTSSIVTVTNFPSATANITPQGSTIICTGDSVELLSDSVGVTYRWYKDGLLIAGATDSNYFADTTGAYTLVVVNAFGCYDSSAKVTITLGVPGPSVPLGVTDVVNICEGDSIVVSVQLNDLNVDTPAITSILVHPRFGTANVMNNDSISYVPNVDFSGLDTIVYRICNAPNPCDTTGAVGCDIELVIINVGDINDAPIAVNDSIIICENTTAIIEVLKNDITVDFDSMYSILLSGPVNGALTIISLDSILYTPGINFAGIDSFRYVLHDTSMITGCNPFGSLTDTATVYIIVNAGNTKPIALDTSIVICYNEASILNISFLVTDFDNDSIFIRSLTTSINNGTIGMINQDSIIYAPQSDYAGDDTLLVEICDRNNSGCGITSLCDTFELNVYISVVDECDTTGGSNLPEVVIPNGFSPNGDGSNDVFEIPGIEEYPDASLLVFNRWGNIVFESEHYQNEWDGNSKSSKRLPDGTYYYILNLDGKQKPVKGYVELHR